MNQVRCTGLMTRGTNDDFNNSPVNLLKSAHLKAQHFLAKYRG
jgi:hypothetical protein